MFPEASPLVLAIDPGSRKWGLAAIDREGRCAARAVVAAPDGPGVVSEWLDRFRREERPVAAVVIGRGTGFRPARERLEAAGIQVVSVPEHHSTLLARDLYWRDHPRRGWRRWWPLGLQTPPEPIDGYAAEVLARQYIERTAR